MSGAGRGGNVGDNHFNGVGGGGTSSAAAGERAQLPEALLTGNTCPKEWAKSTRVKTPTLIEVGKKAPKCVLSFGGAGFLVTYSLGVALYLQKEKKDFLAESYLLGAGSGTLPAIALAAGPAKVSIEKLRDSIVENPYKVTNELRRRELMTKGCEEFLPDDIHTLMNGRCAIAINLSTRDRGFYRQTTKAQLFGSHVSIFDSKEDVLDLVVAATAPDGKRPCNFRGQPVNRATWRSLSSELDPYIRHVYIHGLVGWPFARTHTRHNNYFGRHGMLANTHYPWKAQCFHAFNPALVKSISRDVLLESFEKGFHDARRYERWEEDPYHYAKADRSPGSDTDWKDIRAAVWGRKPPSKEL